MKHGGSFHGKMLVHQRVCQLCHGFFTWVTTSYGKNMLVTMLCFFHVGYAGKCEK